MKNKLRSLMLMSFLLGACNTMGTSHLKHSTQKQKTSHSTKKVDKKGSWWMPSFSLKYPKRGILRTLGRSLCEIVHDYPREMILFIGSMYGLFGTVNGQDSVDVLDVGTKNFSGSSFGMDANGVELAVVSTLEDVDGNNRLAVSRKYTNGTENHYYLNNANFTGEAIKLSNDGLVLGGVDNNNNKSIVVHQNVINTLKNDNAQGNVYGLESFLNDTYSISTYKTGSNPIYSALSKFSGGTEQATILLKQLQVGLIPKAVKYFADHGIIVSGNALNESFAFVCRYFLNMTNRDCHFYDALGDSITVQGMDVSPTGRLGFTGSIDNEMLVFELSELLSINFAMTPRERLELVETWGWDRLSFMGGAALVGIVVGTWLSLISRICSGDGGTDGGIEMNAFQTQIEYSHTNSLNE